VSGTVVCGEFTEFETYAVPLVFILSENWSVMPDNRELQQQIQRIGTLVQEIESIADPSVRASVRELVQLLMEFHGAGLDRALEVVANTGDSGLRVIDELGRDPLVSSLLVLYGLHPDDVDTRVRRAVEHILPKVQRGGGELEVLNISNGSVRLRLSVTGHNCGSTTNTLKSMVEEAIYEAAPDVGSIEVEGMEDKPSVGFVSLDKLRAGVSVSSRATSSREQRSVALPPVV
jgi:Fe-S cluster biogenesis protein NfuA